MYFHEDLLNRINLISPRFAAETEVVRTMYNFALRATEIINNADFITFTGSNVSIRGAKNGEQQQLFAPPNVDEIKNFVEKWNNNMLKMSFSKLKRFCDDNFGMYKCDRRTNNISTHIFRFAKAQEVYVQTNDIQAVMEALREKTQRNAEIYVRSIFYREKDNPFTPIIY